MDSLEPRTPRQPHRAASLARLVLFAWVATGTMGDDIDAEWHRLSTELHAKQAALEAAQRELALMKELEASEMELDEITHQRYVSERDAHRAKRARGPSPPKLSDREARHAAIATYLSACESGDMLVWDLIDFSERRQCEMWMPYAPFGTAGEAKMHYMGAGTVANVSYRSTCRFEGYLAEADVAGPTGGDGAPFASIRLLPEMSFELKSSDGLILEAVGDGNAGYKLSLFTDHMLASGLSYEAPLLPNVGAESDKWAADQIVLPLNHFEARRDGSRAWEAPPLSKAQLSQDPKQLGLIRSKAAPLAPEAHGRVKHGYFWLELRSLRAYSCSNTSDRWGKGEAWGEHDVSWLDGVKEEMDKWWLTLRLNEQETLRQCAGALGLSLSSDFVVKLDRLQCALGVEEACERVARGNGRAAHRDETACDRAVKDATEKVDFPEFPDLPLEFRLPPIPALPTRLLPSGLAKGFRMSSRPYGAPGGARVAQMGGGGATGAKKGAKGTLDLSHAAALVLGFAASMALVGACVLVRRLRRAKRATVRFRIQRRTAGCVVTSKSSDTATRDKTSCLMSS